jgi:hypothetical protein
MALTAGVGTGLTGGVYSPLGQAMIARGIAAMPPRAASSDALLCRLLGAAASTAFGSLASSDP